MYLFVLHAGTAECGFKLCNTQGYQNFFKSTAYSRGSTTVNPLQTVYDLIFVVNPVIANQWPQLPEVYFPFF